MTMTRKDAIKTLRELWRETNNPWYEEVYNMAIEALQAKTDGDIISRADAIKAVWNAYADAINFGDSGEEIASDIDIILSVLPSADAVSREEVTEIKNNYINEISELLNKIDALSAEAVQGEWICKGDYAVCSKCGGSSGTQFDGVEPIPKTTAFCPNCGARMFR